MKRRHVLSVFVALALMPLFGTASPSAAAQRVTLKVSVDGTERTALVDPGRNATTTPSPLVLAFNGFNGTAAQMADMTRFAEVWPEATVVYPQAMRRPSPFGGSEILWQLFPGELEDRD